MEDKKKQDKIEELLTMTKELYVMHDKLEKLDAPITGVRQDILKVCSGLDNIRNQIIGGTNSQISPVEKTEEF